MKIATASILFGVTTFASLTTLSAFADDLTWKDHKGWYLGANAGQSTSRIDNMRIVNGLLEAGSSVSSFSEDGTDFGYKLFGGYQFNKNFAIEGGYFNLGEFDFAATVLPNTINGIIEIEGINLDLVGFLPISEKLSFFARAGVNYAETEDNFSSTGLAPLIINKASERDTNGKFGAGLQYDFNEALAMRFEAERYRINDGVGNTDNADLISLGLVYRFGVQPKPQPVAVVAPAPEPAPRAPRFEKHTFSATELFAFDSSELRMPQPKLDKIAQVLAADSEINQIVITGHTDRIGAEDYNQKLSERRAVAVKNYLVNKGIKPDRLKAEGKGEANPVVDCNDTNRTALITCLQPNRRVEVEEITVMREAK